VGQAFFYLNQWKKGVLNMTKLENKMKKELEDKNFKMADLEQYVKDLEDEICCMDKELKSSNTQLLKYKVPRVIVSMM
jgi:predicted  nucleic acid-binding Zn-ribbon protein